MLERLRQWLNGERNFDVGVSLYRHLQYDEKLLAVFIKGKTPWCYKKLQDELLRICNEMKATGVTSIGTIPILKQKTEKKETATIEKQTTAKNPELYKICKSDADILYKQLMNKRAILFAEVNGDIFLNVNMPDKVENRAKMAIEIVQGFQKVSELYERSEYVFFNGKLPDAETTTEDTYHALPDELVKATLDNLRKLYSKKKKLESTPARVLAIQELEVNINKLETRWNKLKPQR